MTPQYAVLAQRCYEVALQRGRWNNATPHTVALKLLEEIGELARDINRDLGVAVEYPHGKPVGIYSELADIWMVAHGALIHFKQDYKPPSPQPFLTLEESVWYMTQAAAIVEHSKMRGEMELGLGQIICATEALLDHGAIEMKLDYNRNRLIAERTEKVGMV